MPPSANARLQIRSATAPYNWVDVGPTAGGYEGLAVNASDTAGDVADDAADSGNPVKMGARAVDMDGTDPGSVAEDDRADLRTDRNRRLLVNDAHPNHWDVSDNQSSAQAAGSLKAAPGAGLSLYVTDLIISNGATAGEIKIVEDEGGTPVDKIETLYLGANGGAVINFKTPLKLTANKSLGYISTTVTTHSITALGYIAP